MFFRKIINYVGDDVDASDPILPIGICKVATHKPLSISYVDHNGECVNMFVLEPGTHNVKRQKNVNVIVSCDDDNKWSVIIPRRFERSDDTRIAAALVRPKSQSEEMQDYLNEIVARAIGGQTAQKLRSGNAEFDHSEEDYDFDKEDDEDTPLSVHQMNIIMDELQKDLLAKQSKNKQDVPAETGETKDKPGSSEKEPQDQEGTEQKEVKTESAES